MTRARLVAAVVSVALASPALAQTPAQKLPPEDYKIGPEDTLSISVWQNTEVSRTVPVRPDGMISLPLLNDVKAAGLAPMELRDVIAKKLAEYIPSPEVSVIVTEVHSFKVSVIGKVNRPERYTFRSPTTVLDALAQAGGFSEYADSDKIVVIRPTPFYVQGKVGGRTFKRIPFNYKRVITVGGETENFYLEPNDIIVVP